MNFSQKNKYGYKTAFVVNPIYFVKIICSSLIKGQICDKLPFLYLDNANKFIIRKCYYLILDLKPRQEEDLALGKWKGKE